MYQVVGDAELVEGVADSVISIVFSEAEETYSLYSPTAPNRSQHSQHRGGLGAIPLANVLQSLNIVPHKSMALIVHKYGGTSVGSVDRIKAVAERIAKTVTRGHQVVAVVSAMGKQTDTLVDLANQLVPTPTDAKEYRREMDMLLSTGEQVSIALLSMALQQINCPAISLNGAASGNSHRTRAFPRPH